MSYLSGNLIRIAAKFTVSGILTDPTTVAAFSKDPQGTVTTLLVVKDDVGIYHADILAVAPGVWVFRWEGTGAAQGAGEGEFTVDPSKL